MKSRSIHTKNNFEPSSNSEGTMTHEDPRNLAQSFSEYYFDDFFLSSSWLSQVTIPSRQKNFQKIFIITIYFYVDVCTAKMPDIRGVFRTYSNMYDELFFAKIANDF